MILAIEGQVSLFDLPQITHKEVLIDKNTSSKIIIKRVRFQPKEIWKAKFFKEKRGLNYLKI